MDLWCANSNTDINIISINDVIPVNNSIDNWLILEPTYSSLEQDKQQHWKSMFMNMHVDVFASVHGKVLNNCI